MEVTKPQVFVNMEEIMQRILALTLKEVEKFGVVRSALKRMKDRIVKDGKINLKTHEVKKLLNVM